MTLSMDPRVCIVMLTYIALHAQISTVEETRDRALSFSRDVEFMRWFPVALLINSMLI